MIAKEKREEDEEFEHLLAMNEERNREAAEFVSTFVIFCVSLIITIKFALTFR